MDGMRAREQGAAPADWRISECHSECADYERDACDGDAQIVTCRDSSISLANLWRISGESLAESLAEKLVDETFFGVFFCQFK